VRLRQSAGQKDGRDNDAGALTPQTAGDDRADPEKRRYFR
jgi:hypothetical protein